MSALVPIVQQGLRQRVRLDAYHKTLVFLYLEYVEKDEYISVVQNP